MVRFGCGFALGILLLVAYGFWIFDLTPVGIVFGVVVAVVFGLAARRFGDRFWEWLHDHGWI